jgi:glycosyltransferase involved in cell wall biosynthesis
MGRLDFDIAVFAVNEAATIGACIASIDQACAGRDAHISVLLNGTTDNSVEILRAMRLSHAAMTVYRFPVADKANAINHYLYEIRREAAVHFGVDAYTRIGEASFKAMAEAFLAHPKALITAALPVSGRSAKVVAANTMKGGMANGQCYGLRPDFVDRLVEARYQLPLQLYRVDGLLGSMGAHELDAINTPWDNARVIGVAEASFALTPLSIFKLRDISRQYNREIRQARGRMENAAIKSLIYAGGYGALPINANDMIKNWLNKNHPSSRSIREKYFTQLAIRQIVLSSNIISTKPDIIAI